MDVSKYMSYVVPYIMLAMYCLVLWRVWKTTKADMNILIQVIIFFVRLMLKILNPHILKKIHRMSDFLAAKSKCIFLVFTNLHRVRTRNSTFHPVAKIENKLILAKPLK